MAKNKFITKPRQVDYANIRWAPVVNCVVKYKGRFLVVQRSRNLGPFPLYWNGVSGFLDDRKSLNEKVVEELREEAGMPKRKITRIRLGEIFDLEDPKCRKTWIVHPVLVEVDDEAVKLNWEAKSYKWVTLREARKLKLLPGFNRVLEKLSAWIDNERGSRCPKK